MWNTLAVGVTNPEVPFMTSQRLPELCVLEYGPINVMYYGSTAAFLTGEKC